MVLISGGNSEHVGLVPTSLWLHPKEAARFLQLDVGEEDVDDDMKEEKKMMMKIEGRAK